MDYGIPVYVGAGRLVVYSVLAEWFGQVLFCVSSEYGYSIGVVSKVGMFTQLSM